MQNGCQVWDEDEIKIRTVDSSSVKLQHPRGEICIKILFICVGTKRKHKQKVFLIAMNYTARFKFHNKMHVPMMAVICIHCLIPILRTVPVFGQSSIYIC